MLADKWVQLELMEDEFRGLRLPHKVMHNTVQFRQVVDTSKVVDIYYCEDSSYSVKQHSFLTPSSFGSSQGTSLHY